MWRTIKDFPLYQVNHSGVVRNVTTGNNLTQTEHTGKGTTYLRVTLYNNGKRKNKRVHRLVAEAFLANPENYEHVNHKDRNTFNNHFLNLEWSTHAENMRHGDAR